MLTDTKSHKKLHKATQSDGRYVGYQKKTGLNKDFSGGTAVGRGIQKEQTQVEMREEENLWEPTSKMNRLLSLEESESNMVRITFFVTYLLMSESNSNDITSMSHM